jgi:hypothetical protein
MDTFYAPRPEDFRLAWPNAYSQAMRLSLELHRRSDEILMRSETLMRDSNISSERTRDNLYRTGHVFVAEVRKSGVESAHAIGTATNHFLKVVGDAQAQDLKVHDEIRKEVQNLLKEQQALQKFRVELNARPLWERLWLALHRRY